MSQDQNAGRIHSVRFDNSTFERVDEFKYLGTNLTNQNSIFTYLLHGAVLLEKQTGSAASQEIPCTLCNLKVQHCIHKCPPSVPILSQLHPVSTSSHFPKIHLNIILPSRSGSPQWALSLRVPQ